MKYFKDLINELSYEDIYDYYINENHTIEECNKHFDLTGSMFPRLLKHFGIKKPKDLHVKNIKRVKLEKYGNENYNNVDQIKATCVEKYGVDNQFKREDLMEEVRKRIEEKYGSKNNIYKNHLTRIKSSGDLKSSYLSQVDKIRLTVQEKYNVEWASKAECVKESIKKSLKETFQDKYGCDNYWCSADAIRSNGSKNSHANIAFEKLLIENNINYEKEFLLENRWYDFKVDNTLIEINPTATHNSTWSPWCADKGLDIHYHADKTDLAVKNGYKCVHVWDWDNQQLIIDTLLKNKSSVGARQCEIKIVDNASEVSFLNSYHLQGYTKSDTAIGLYDGGELVLLMTFGKPRFSKKYQWELIRLCSSKKVIGGAQRALKYFIDNYNPKSIISYCDLSKFEGAVYTSLGFKKLGRAISRHWYNIKLKDHITDKLLFKYGFDKLLGNVFGNYGPNTSNEQLMLMHDFVEVYDCGQATYVLNRKEV